MWVDMNFHVAGRQQVEVGRDGIIYIFIYIRIILPHVTNGCIYQYL